MTYKKIIRGFLVSFLSFSALMLVLPGHSQADAPAICDDGTTGCGWARSYNMYFQCSMSGPDVINGIRILGGQVCSIGGADSSGSYTTNTGTPDDNTPYSPNPGSVPPGWTYTKSSTRANIPATEFQDDPYGYFQFFGGSASAGIQPPDDELVLQIGSNILSYTGCPARITDVTKTGCPGRVYSGVGNFNANPGDGVTFTLTNKLRPNNGSGPWAGGSGNLSLGEVTECYTKAKFDAAQNARPTGMPHVDYHPVSPGHCAPTISACIINSFTASPFVNGSSTLAWSVIPNGNPISINQSVGSVGNTGSTKVSPTNTTTYTLTCGNQTRSQTVTPPTPKVAGIGLSAPDVITLQAGQDVSGPHTFMIWNAGSKGSQLKNVRCNTGQVIGIPASKVIVECDLTEEVFTAQ